MKPTPTSFDSARLAHSQRQDAFARFCDASPNRMLSRHSLMSLSTDNPELHSAQRRFGDEIYAASTRSTGYGMTFERHKSGPASGIPVSVGLMREGACEFQTGHGTHRLKAGDVYISTLTATRFAVSESFATRILFADQRFCSAVDQNGRLIVLGGSTPMGQLLASTVISIEQSLAIDGHLSAQDPLNQIAKEIVLRVLDAEGPQLRSSPKDRLREKARGFVLENLALENLSPDMLSSYLGMSRAATFRLFADDGGVMSFVTQIRLKVGRSMLASAPPGQRKVSEIACLCGFKSPSHFSTAFKRVYGMAPSNLVDTQAKTASEPQPRRTYVSREAP